MKRIFCISVCFLFLFLISCSEQNSPESPQRELKQSIEEFRTVWISCYDLQRMDSSSEDTFVKDIKSAFKYIKDLGLNTVIVQVRPFADAIYPSEIFPWSKYICNGKEPGYDPLQILIDIAYSFDLSFHAWVNPYRISHNNDYKKLPADSPALEFIDKEDSTVVAIEKGIFFNPASLSAQNLIIEGIREIIENYDVDAIHIDDYFYPTTDADFDSKEYTKYAGSGGTLSLSDWRRENVNSLLSGIYSAIKSYDKKIEFGISPGGNIQYNYNNLYADVKLWCSSNGYLDYIIPQMYFGFYNTGKPFAESAQEWTDILKNPEIKLYGGLALYKSGAVDNFCSDEKSKNEWIESDDIIKRQIEFLRENNAFSGFALFSLRNLSDFTNKNLKIEIQNIRSVL